jgi:chaperonin GroES
MSVRPIRDQIVVSKNETESKSPGGIHIVVREEKNVSGTVLAVGVGHLTSGGALVPLDVKVGDKVLFNKSMASEVNHKGETVYVLAEASVICVLE